MSTTDNEDLSSIPSCLKQLQLYLDEAKYSEASKLCHKCLKEWPGENAFYRVKVFCEIQLSRWHSCLQTIGWLHGYRTHPAVSDKPRKRRERGNKTKSVDSVDLTAKGREAMEKIREACKVHKKDENCLWLHFEQSYCYYKLGKYNLGLEALSLCHEEMPPRDPVKGQKQKEYHPNKMQFPEAKSNLLKAQLCLRMGHFKEAKDIYESLKLKGAESLLTVNNLSVDLSLVSDSQENQRQPLLEKINKKIEEHLDRGKKEDPYELYFNYACASILSKNILKAEDYLDVANEMLENELKQMEGEGESEEQVELSNILAFRAFINDKKGNKEMAKKINTRILNTFINSPEVDQATVLVALNNQLLLGWDEEDLTNLVHKIEVLMKKEQIIRKFSKSELNSIHGNIVWTYLSTGNLKECQKYLENCSRYMNQEDKYFFKSALMCMDGKVSKGVSLLRQGLSMSKNLKFVECISKVLLRSGKHKEALNVLHEYSKEFVENTEYLKSYFLLLVKINIQTNSPERVYATLKELLSHKKARSEGKDEAIQLGCKYLESQNKNQEALEVYRQVYENNHRDRLAQLGVLYNQSFTEQKYLEMPEDYVDDVVRDVRFIDAEELEAEYKVTYQFQDQNKEQKSKVKKRRTKRKNKKPKNPTGNPDPERWLHKYERMSYKKYAKRRKEASKGATQGSTSTGPSKPTTGTITARSNAIKRQEIPTVSEFIMSTHNTSDYKKASIRDFFKPRASRESNEEQKKQVSLFNSDDDDDEPRNQDSPSELDKLKEYVKGIDIENQNTTTSEPELATTHQEPGLVYAEDWGEECLPVKRNRSILFDDEDEWSLKVKDEYEEEEEKVEEKDQLTEFEFKNKTEEVKGTVTLGKEDPKREEDSIDYEEREKYIKCKASQTSTGFKAYVDNYYRYKGTFLFPPWLEPKNIRDLEGKKPTEEGYDPGTVWIPPKNHKWAIQYRSGHYTECMQQWWNIKKTHFDSLIFFKMGKFYELFYHDACIIQNLANLRWMGSESKPHVGFPEKSLHTYASASVNAGYRVVVVEQTETPQQLEKRNKESGKVEKAVKRDVCEIITAGTVSRPEMLGKQSRPLVIVTRGLEDEQSKNLAVVSIDVSMGKIRFGEVRYTKEFFQLKTALIHLCPAEVVVEKGLMENKDLLVSVKSLPYTPEVTSYQQQDKEATSLYERVSELYKEEADRCERALLLAESYLKFILMEKLVEYCYIEPLNMSEIEVMNMDYSAITHLELFTTQEGTAKNSLFDYLNKTNTAFGERMLRNWLLNPLTSVREINKRSECVEFLVRNMPLVTTLNQDLDKFPDLERSLGKILNTASNYHKKAVYFDEGVFTKLYDLYNLLDKFKKLEDILLNFLSESLEMLEDERSELLDEINNNFIRCSEDVVHFKSMLRPMEDKKCQSSTWKKSIQIRQEIEQVTSKLEEILEAIQKLSPSATYVNCKFRFEVEMTESDFQKYQKRFNNMEITSTRSGFIRSRSVKIVQIIEELEEKEFKLKESEEEFYQFIVREFHKNSFKFCKLIETASTIDCLGSLATVAKNSSFQMTRPILHPKSKNIFKVTDSIYPIFNVKSKKFVPNDVCIGEFEESQTPIIIITGPNMGGKSTLLRQIGLTVIMGQIGSFVSGSYCEFSVVDSIFTRLGASDNLLEGKSTFLVELQDISSILSKATRSSMALIDELGRGTSTFDGTAIAVATLEKISKMGCRCVFTTHFQDVCVSAKALKNIAMFHMAAKVDEESESVEFLYKLAPGICPDSHGLHVAKLARIPDHVIERAKRASLRLKRPDLKDSREEEYEMLADKIIQAHQAGDEELLHNIYNKYAVCRQ